MRRENKTDAWSFQHLDWDSEFFNVSCAKATINRSLSSEEWQMLKSKFKNYKFVTIVNSNSNTRNSQLIGEETNAFLADVNIQFNKKLGSENLKPKNIYIQDAINKDERIIELINFHFSRFNEDPELAKRGGGELYKHWIMNSLNNPSKFFALSKDGRNKVNGFLLYSFSNRKCIIELIGVLNEAKGKGIATRLFEAVEFKATERGYSEIKVGTQVRNQEAINFYSKVGCKQSECHQVYHLWKA